ncbi:MAG: RimK/LysX family protein [Nevskiales bacterium]
MGTRTGRLSLAVLAGALCAFGARAGTPDAATAQPVPLTHVYGRLEHAVVTGSPSIEVQAQLVGGGDATVLLVQDIKYASGEGGTYVHFTIDNGEVMPGKTINLALPVLKDQHVHDRDGGTVHQPVVAMSFCIGDHAFTTNVTLKLRGNYVPPLLLGKADAAQFGQIDPLKKNTVLEARCAPPAAAAVTPPTAAAH